MRKGLVSLPHTRMDILSTQPALAKPLKGLKESKVWSKHRVPLTPEVQSWEWPRITLPTSNGE